LRDRGNRQRLLERQQHDLRGPTRTPCEDDVIGLDLLARLAGILDSKCLEVLICRFWDDMTQDEIAAFLGTSRKTVGKRLIKIRAQVIALRADAARAGADADEPPGARRSKDA
jgi:DNA-directed RNA polymerase specialized sigma24 family protein